MTQAQINSAELVVELALEIHADKQHAWDNNINEIVKAAFSELRLKSINENRYKIQENIAQFAEQEKRECERAIYGLREYISYFS